MLEGAGNVNGWAELLDGEYAFFRYDMFSEQIQFGTDELRMRPLFACQSLDRSNPQIVLCSEQKCCPGWECIPVPPGTYSCNAGEIMPVVREAWGQINDIGIEPPIEISFDVAAKRLRDLLISNVERKLHPDREYAFFLSGGLDSSLVCAISQMLLRHRGIQIKTFTIGFSPESSDVVAARAVAEHIGSEHHEIITTYEEGVKLIPELIYTLETWDQTTIRASTPMMLCMKYIKENFPNIAVVYSGELADELLRGYLYNRITQWPDGTEITPDEMELDRMMRLKHISYFDGIRADRVASSVGCEVRYPFYGRDLMNFCRTLPRSYLNPANHGGVEKYILRKAFEDLLPASIIWRTKNAFSDATSAAGSHKKSASWKAYLKKCAVVQFDSLAEQDIPIRTHHCPSTVEDSWYRSIFDQYQFDDRAIPYRWMPSFVPETVTDSSATCLAVFNEG